MSSNFGVSACLCFKITSITLFNGIAHTFHETMPLFVDARSGTSMSLMQRLTSWSQPARLGGLWQTFSTRLSFEKHLPNSVFNPYSWQVQARFKHRSVWSPLNLDKFPLASVGNQRQGHHVEQLKDMSVRLQEQTPMYFPGKSGYDLEFTACFLV